MAERRRLDPRRVDDEVRAVPRQGRHRPRRRSRARRPRRRRRHHARHGRASAAGNLMEAAGGIGQRIQKQIGQTGIPVYNVANACATGATAFRTRVHGDQGRRGRHGPRGRRREDGQGRPRRRRRGRAPTSNVYEPSGRYGSVMRVEGVLGTGTHARRVRAGRHGVRHEHDGVGFEQFAKVAEKNHAHSTLNPLAQYQKQFSLEEVMDAEMIAYPNTLPMCCPTGDGARGGRARVGGEARDASPTSSASGR